MLCIHTITQRAGHSIPAMSVYSLLAPKLLLLQRRLLYTSLVRSSQTSFLSPILSRTPSRSISKALRSLLGKIDNKGWKKKKKKRKREKLARGEMEKGGQTNRHTRKLGLTCLDRQTAGVIYILLFTYLESWVLNKMVECVGTSINRVNWKYVGVFMQRGEIQSRYSEKLSIRKIAARRGTGELYTDI